MDHENNASLNTSETAVFLFSVVGGAIISTELTENVIPGPVKDSATRDRMIAKAMEYEGKSQQAEEFAVQIKDTEGLIDISNSYKNQAASIRDSVPNPNIYGVALETTAVIFIPAVVAYTAIKMRATRRVRASQRTK